jgi:hypothetical protein
MKISNPIPPHLMGKKPPPPPKPPPKRIISEDVHPIKFIVNMFIKKWMEGTKRADRYIKGVLDGSVPAPLFVIQACERHNRDLERADIYYDRKVADKQVRNIGRLTHANRAVLCNIII